MKEKLSTRIEQAGEHGQELSTHKEALRQSAEKRAASSRHEHAEKLDEIRSLVEKTAKGKHEHDAHRPEQEHRENRQPTTVNKELKDMAYRRTLKRAQSRLPAPARAFSKVIHNPVVETTSEFLGKTIARPSGILAGGIAALVGSTIFLWVARHYGYEYNFLLFALCFVGGFIIGVLTELGIKLANRRSH